MRLQDHIASAWTLDPFFFTSLKNIDTEFLLDNKVLGVETESFVDSPKQNTHKLWLSHTGKTEDAFDVKTIDPCDKRLDHFSTQEILRAFVFLDSLHKNRSILLRNNLPNRHNGGITSWVDWIMQRDWEECINNIPYPQYDLFEQSGSHSFVSKWGIWHSIKDDYEDHLDKEGIYNVDGKHAFFQLCLFEKTNMHNALKPATQLRKIRKMIARRDKEHELVAFLSQ